MKAPWTRTRQAALAIATIVLAASPAGAQSLEERPGYVAAVSALQNGSPDTAAVKLAELLEAASDLTPVESNQIRLLRLEALVRARGIGPALTAAADPAFGESPEKAFWHGLALTRAGSHAQALERLETIERGGDEGFAHRDELVFNLAMLRHRFGDHESALAALRPYLDPGHALPSLHERAILMAAGILIDRDRLDEADELLDRPVRDSADPAAEDRRELLRGRLALRRERPAAAVAIYERVAARAPETLTGQRAVLGQADVAAGQGVPRKAAGILLDFIERFPRSPVLGAAFERLASFGGLPLPSTVVQLGNWSSDNSQPSRQALALLFSARAAGDAGNQAAALDYLSRFLAAFPRHPLRETAQVQQIEALIEAGRTAEAAESLAAVKEGAVLPVTGDQLSLLHARLAAAENRSSDALPRFGSLIESSRHPVIREIGAFNGAIAAVAAGDEEAYEAFAERLTRGPDPHLAGDLMLERGLFEAARAETAAFEHLETFVRRYPGHPRVADAEIALAELYLNQVPAQPVSARDYLDSVQLKPLTLEQREWLDYVAIWIEVAAEDSEKILTRARRFLDDWPQSGRRPSVFMVLGETFFHAEDYPNASRYFEALAEESPSAPSAEAALFFAAKAAGRTLAPENQQRALDLWQRVVDGAGPLAPAALHEQGLLMLSAERFDEAVAAFEGVTALENATPLMKIAALADKGEALYAKAAVFEGDNTGILEEAAAAFDAVTRQEGVTKSWRLQASVRRGKCLEALGRSDQALELYFSLVRDGAPAGPVAAAPTAEFDWFFRAGLSAIKLLQSEENWEEAVAIADQVVQNGGPRASEAARIADRLRLRHFIWEEPGR